MAKLLDDTDNLQKQITEAIDRIKQNIAVIMNL